MRKTARIHIGWVAVAALALALGCKDTTRPPGGFPLTDVNPNSATYNQAVSPAQQLGSISAWYFGHAT